MTRNLPGHATTRVRRRQDGRRGRLSSHALLPLLLCVPLLVGFDPFRSSNGNVEQGNAQLQAGKPKEALDLYNKAAKDLPDEPGVQYNRGVALHRLGQFEKAREAFAAATAASEPTLKQRSFYNLGNAWFELKKYKEAADAYRQALRLEPGHRASKWNLELALKRIRDEEKKKQEQEKNKNKDKDKNKDKKEENKDNKNKDKKEENKNNQQDNKDQEKKQKEQDKDKQQDKQKQQEEQSKQDRPRPQPQPREQDAVLDALERNDKTLQRERLRGLVGAQRPPVKDW